MTYQLLQSFSGAIISVLEGTVSELVHEKLREPFSNLAIYQVQQGHPVREWHKHRIGPIVGFSHGWLFPTITDTTKQLPGHTMLVDETLIYNGRGIRLEDQRDADVWSYATPVYFTTRTPLEVIAEFAEQYPLFENVSAQGTGVFFGPKDRWAVKQATLQQLTLDELAARVKTSQQPL